MKVTTKDNEIIISFPVEIGKESKLRWVGPRGKQKQGFELVNETREIIANGKKLHLTVSACIL